MKVTVVTALKEGLLVGMRSMSVNPYDGLDKRIEGAIEQVGVVASHQPRAVMVDKGYRGVAVDGVQILRSGQRRRVTRMMGR